MAVLSGTLTGHPAKSKNARSIFIDCLCDDGIELQSIFGAGKEILAVITPQNDVLRLAG